MGYSMDTTEKLYQALKEANTTIENFQQIVNELSIENAFLTDTITKNQLGQITTERRKLQADMLDLQLKSDKAISNAKEMVTQYSQMMDTLDKMTADVNRKQQDINKYIDTEAEKIIQKSAQEYRKKHQAMIAIMVACVLFGLICLFVNFT